MGCPFCLIRSKIHSIPKPSKICYKSCVFSDLTLYCFRVLIELGPGRQNLPPYLGSTLRGAFASSFRQLVCVTHQRSCDGCLLLSRCSYPYIFETPPPAHIPVDLQRRFRQAPRPYVFEVPLRYRGEQELELGLMLVGKAIDFLPYFIYVLNEIGKLGLGVGRVPYRLLAVMDGSQPDGPVVFDTQEQILHENFSAITLDAFAAEKSAELQRVTLEFLTPLRMKRHGTYQLDDERIDFLSIMELLIGRVETLSVFHCDGQWLPSEPLLTAARQVRVTDKQLTFHYLERYSNRQQRKLPLHGLLGTMTFAGDISQFLPLLQIGEYLHLGAGTAFGLGQYRLIG